MKIVLIRCLANESARETNVAGVYPPLGLASLAASLKKAGHEPLVIDAEAMGWRIERVLREIPPDAGLAGITAATLTWPTARRASFAIKSAFPRMPLVAGGPQITAFPEDSLDGSAFDAVVAGDGERAIVEMAERLSAGTGIAAGPGVAARVNGKITPCSPPEWITDLDALPFPAFDCLPMNRYHSVLVEEPFATMVASRGCPFRCRFCSQAYTGEKWRRRGPESIVAEIERDVGEFGAKEIVFFDETFGVNKEEALRVCALIKEKKLNVRWNARSRVDTLDRELLSAMYGAGCRALHLGIESGSPRILDMMNKKITVEQARSAAGEAKKLGFLLHGYFMLGYPGETRKEMRATSAFARELPLDWASFTITVPHPLTPLFKTAADAGLAPADYWREYSLGKREDALPFFASKDCTARELRKIKNKAYIAFYARPGPLLRVLKFMFNRGGVRRVLKAAFLWLKEIF